MAAPVFDVNIVTREFWDMMTRMGRTLEPRRFGLRFTGELRRRFRDQVEESFSREGPGWAPLSDWRVTDRNGAERPVLVWSGSFFQEVMAYKGEVRMINSGFSMWYPGFKEMSGRYWGLTAGQMVNPLGAAPLAQFPRRVLGDRSRQELDSIDALIRYFTSEGWHVDIGG